MMQGMHNCSHNVYPAGKAATKPASKSSTQLTTPSSHPTTPQTAPPLDSVHLGGKQLPVWSTLHVSAWQRHILYVAVELNCTAI